jgi:ABC-2 type transport system permease protein
MNKILLIIQREYLSRVKKKSFLLMTFLVPLLIIGMYALIAVLSIQGGDAKTEVQVLDESGIFAGSFKDKGTVRFQVISESLPQAKKDVAANENFVLYIPAEFEKTGEVQMFSKKKPGISALSTIEDQMNEILRAKRLKDAGIDAKTLDAVKSDISIVSKEITAEGEKDSSAGAAYAVGFAAAILIYMSLFIYGAQVMRGVIEEKTSRIIEVIVSSVKPFQLMMGKIIGIGLVGLTQFLLWIILSTTLTGIAGKELMKDRMETIQAAGGQQTANAAEQAQADEGGKGAEIIQAMKTINFPYILGTFLIYFLGGFMLYSALFAAVGSAVDSETETQQFMFPITLPLLFTYIMSFSFIVNNPDSTLSFWLSIIPFTSPIAMMVRLPFGVPEWQLLLSVVLLIGGFVFTTWIAARIYRVGILMYGKKTSYKELAKWFMYKE